MIGVEAFDELLAVNILLVGRAAVPKMRVPVDDENLFTVSSSVHGDFSLSRHAGDFPSGAWSGRPLLKRGRRLGRPLAVSVRNTPARHPYCRNKRPCCHPP